MERQYSEALVNVRINNFEFLTTRKIQYPGPPRREARSGFKVPTNDKDSEFELESDSGSLAAREWPPRLTTPSSSAG